MMILSRWLGIGCLLIFTASCSITGARMDDLYLEEVEGAKALDWVKKQNQRTVAELEKDPRFKEIKELSLKRLNDPRRIALASILQNEVVNFWRDEKNPKGLLRMASLTSYLTGKPKWQPLLDVDKLSAEEKTHWVFQGIRTFKSKSLITLSNGGKDASQVREFDVASKKFVEGFNLPEAKSDVDWLDEDQIFVATDFGPGSLTSSGYPREIKLWKRGEPLTQARPIFSGELTDVGVSVQVDRDKIYGPAKQIVFTRIPSFFERIYYLWDKRQDLRELKLPHDADLSFFQDQALIYLRTNWKVGAEIFSKGSLLLADLASLQTASPNVRKVFEPDAKQSIQEYRVLGSRIYVSLLENVNGRLLEITYGAKKFKARNIKLPSNGSLGIVSVSRDQNLLLLTHQTFLQPVTLFSLSAGEANPKKITAEPAHFDTKAYVVEQLQAQSKDGTTVPYYLIHSKNWEVDGNRPIILDGYGGFEISRTPTYASLIEAGWLRYGGALAVANIRGGGEFGPDWHLSAIKENRQRAFDDFIAVAENLISRQFTNPTKLAISGGSNGGLLVGVVMMQRPELFAGVLCRVPLLDMLRYHHLLAGASWMGEYGNPDDESDRKFLLRYSPYHLLRPERAYPAPLFYTSTKDDRVHPSHARRMAHKMQEYGQSFYYYENMEGGHSAAADFEQRAFRQALESAYLFKVFKN